MPGSIKTDNLQQQCNNNKMVMVSSCGVFVANNEKCGNHIAHQLNEKGVCQKCSCSSQTSTTHDKESKSTPSKSTSKKKNATFAAAALATTAVVAASALAAKSQIKTQLPEKQIIDRDIDDGLDMSDHRSSKSLINSYCTGKLKEEFFINQKSITLPLENPGRQSLDIEMFPLFVSSDKSSFISVTRSCIAASLQADKKSEKQKYTCKHRHLDHNHTITNESDNPLLLITIDSSSPEACNEIFSMIKHARENKIINSNVDIMFFIQTDWYFTIPGKKKESRTKDSHEIAKNVQVSKIMKAILNNSPILEEKNSVSLIDLKNPERINPDQVSKDRDYEAQLSEDQMVDKEQSDNMNQLIGASIINDIKSMQNKLQSLSRKSAKANKKLSRDLINLVKSQNDHKYTMAMLCSIAKLVKENNKNLFSTLEDAIDFNNALESNGIPAIWIEVRKESSQNAPWIFYTSNSLDKSIDDQYPLSIISSHLTVPLMKDDGHKDITINNFNNDGTLKATDEILSPPIINENISPNETSEIMF